MSEVWHYGKPVIEDGPNITKATAPAHGGKKEDCEICNPARRLTELAKGE